MDTTREGDHTWYGTHYNGGKDSNLDYSRFIQFSYDFTVTKDLVGDALLRARTACNHPVGSIGFPNFDYSEDAAQGEVEDYMFRVSEVPEPTTMLLFGTGLIGLAGIARRRKK